MWKKILIGIALGVVIDTLIEFATRMKDQAGSEAGKFRWDIFIQILLMVKGNPTLLNNKNDGQQ